MKQKIINFFGIFISIFFVWIFISSIIFKSNVYYNQNRLLSLLISPIILLLWYISYNKIFKKIKISFKCELIILLIYFSFIILMQFVIIKNFSVFPGWDFGVVFDNALEFVQNGTRRNAVYIEYFQYFPNNIMLFAMFTITIKIGTFLSLTAMESLWLVNIFLIDISILLIYLFCRKKYSLQAGLFSLFVVLFFIPLFLYTPIFYSDTFSLFIGVLFAYLYLFIDKNKFSKKNVFIFTLIGITAFLGKTIKITSLIVLIALIVDYVWHNNKKYVVYHMPIILVTFLILNIVFTNVVVNNKKFNFKINDYGNYPITHWIMMGVENPNFDNTNRNAYGGYNEKDYEFTRSFETGSDAKKSNIQETMKRIRDYGPYKYFIYLSKKGANAWGDGLYYSDIALNINPVEKNTFLRNIIFNNNYGNYALIYVTQGVQFSFLILLIGGLLFKKEKNEFNYIRLSIFGLALFLLLWENRSRYLLNFIPLFILYIVGFFNKYRFRRGDVMKKIYSLYIKYKELIMYAIFGVLTTLVNIISFFFMDRMGMDIYINNTISWIISVLFAFFTNKFFVFESKETSIKILLREGISFFGARLLSYFIDMATIYVLIKIIGINKMVSKIISNVIVIIINYIISKLFIFKKKGGADAENRK